MAASQFTTVVSIRQNVLGLYKSTVCRCCEFKTALFVGSHIGTVMGMKVSGILCHYCGWESVFYVFGKKRRLLLHVRLQYYYVMCYYKPLAQNRVENEPLVI